MFKLVPIRPLRQTRKLRNSSNAEDVFDQFFNSFFNDDVFVSFDKLNSGISSFLVDVLDDGDKYIVEAELPGFDKENVKLEYHDQHLTIVAKRPEASVDSNYIRKERCGGEFKRSFYVDNIVPDKINANFENGILRVTLHKEPLKNDLREITID